MSIFNTIKSHVSIVDVIGEYTTLKPAGSYFKSHCPFHHEKTASFTVSPERGIFYCFGCHVSGDVIAFIAQLEQCSQHEAARHLADRYNIEMPRQFSESHENIQKKQHYFDICRAVAEWCHQQLLQHKIAQDYLASRNIAEASWKRFCIGYFPGGLGAIKHLFIAMKDKSILTDDLLETHIVSKGKTVYFSPFENRLLFPISDHLGRFCGFGARILDPTDTRAKYYNSRENDLFQKGSILFGLDNAKKSIKESGYVFMVEGYTDCITMAEHGYKNTVATLGTSCTLAHLKLLARYTRYVYVLYDSDAAGTQALLRLTSLCWQANVELKVVLLPAGQDPASFLQSGNDLAPLIKQAQDIFGYYIEYTSTDFAQAPLYEKITTIRQLITIIREIGDPLKRDLLIQMASRSFDVPFETLKRELAREKSPSTPSDQSGGQNELVEQKKGPSALEKQIFSAILNRPELCDSQRDVHVIASMSQPIQKVLNSLLAMKESISSFEFNRFFDSLSAEEQSIVSNVLITYQDPTDAMLYQELCTQLLRQQWKKVLKRINTELILAQHQGDAQKVEKLMQDYQTLKQLLLPAT